jgi:hypothetical protein
MYLVIVRLYVAIEYAMLVLFFAYIFNSKKFKLFAYLSIVPFWLFSLYNYYESDQKVFSNIPVITLFIILIAIILFYFYTKMKIVSIYPLYKLISFWLCVGLFIYFSGNLFYLLFIMSIKDAALNSQMKIVYTVVSITKDLILSFAWLAHERIETEADIIKIPDGLGLDDDLPFLKQTNS